MVSQWIRNLGHKASHVQMLRPLYDVQLGHLEKPLHFISFPADLWGGDIGHGQWMTSGKIAIGNHRVPLGIDHWLIDTELQRSPFFNKIHQFDFLLDLKALGGNVGRKTARLITQEWIQDFKNYHHITWGPSLTAYRLVNWLTAYPFCFEQADDEFIHSVQESFYRQLRHLIYTLNHDTKLDPFERFDLLWGLCLVSCHCPKLGGQNFDSWLILLKGALEEITYDDGGTTDRSLATLMTVIKNLLTLHYSLRQNKIQSPLWLEKYIETSVKILNNIIHSDKTFPCFQGMMKTLPTCLDKLTRLSNVRIRKSDLTLLDSGYSAIRKKRTSLLIDHRAGKHNAPFAFEMSHGVHRIIVGCGTHLYNPEWQDSLSGINAHSALNIEDTEPDPAFLDEIKANIEHMNGACLWNATHNGYKQNHNTTHTRRIYLDSNGEDCRGEDLLIRSVTTKPLEIAARFHLHPNVKASLIKKGTAVLVQLSSGVGWMFEARNAFISLEPSIYLGDDGLTIRKTKQIILTKNMTDLTHQIKWRMRRT